MVRGSSMSFLHRELYRDEYTTALCIPSLELFIISFKQAFWLLQLRLHQARQSQVSGEKGWWVEGGKAFR